MQKFFDALARWWLYHWTVDHTDIIYKKHACVDLCIMLSYASKEDALTNASRIITIRGAGMAKNYFSGALLAITTCAYAYPQEERAHKHTILRDYNPSSIETRIIWVENIYHTFDEVWKIYRAVMRRRANLKLVVVITGQTHSRTARLIYRALFPNATVLISAISAESEYQPDHPIFVQQTRSRWFYTALLRHAVARVLFMRLPIIGFPFLRIGLRFLESRHHHIA